MNLKPVGQDPARKCPINGALYMFSAGKLCTDAEGTSRQLASRNLLSLSLSGATSANGKHLVPLYKPLGF